MCAQSAQLRADAVRLRDQLVRSLEELRATTQAALRAAEAMQSGLGDAQVRVAVSGPHSRAALVQQLEARLANLPVIEQAKGILIAEQGCSPDEAFDILRRASQRKNRKLRRIAEDVVAAHGPRSGGLTGSRRVDA